MTLGIFGVITALYEMFSIRGADSGIAFGFILSVLETIAGFRLLALSPGWRTFTLFICWWSMTVPPALILAFIFQVVVGMVNMNRSNIPFEDIISVFWPFIILPIFILLVFLFSLWIYKVLTRPDIRILFGVGIGDEIIPSKFQ